MEEKFLQEIEQRIGYKFSDRHILVKAFTHSSAVDSQTAEEIKDMNFSAILFWGWSFVRKFSKNSRIFSKAT